MLSGGHLVEQGSHQQLLALGGVYSMLVKAQADADKSTSEQGALVRKLSSRRDLQRQRSASRRKSGLAGGSQAEGKGAEEAGAQTEVEEEEEEKVPSVAMSRVWSYSRPDMGYVVLGCVAAALTGCAWPFFAIIYSRLTSALYLPHDEIMSEAGKWALLFGGLGLLQLITQLVQFSCFSVVGERLTLRLRSACFKAILRQEIGFFDEKRHSSGRLTARLATEATTVRNMTADEAGQIVQIVATMILALIIAFIAGWKLTLIVLGVGPFMAVTGELVLVDWSIGRLSID